MRVLVFSAGASAACYGFSRKRTFRTPGRCGAHDSAGQGSLLQEGVIDEQSGQVLAAEDTLSRQYSMRVHGGAGAVHASSDPRTGQMPHREETACRARVGASNRDDASTGRERQHRRKPLRVTRNDG
jgi:hypothetical protein